MPMQSIHRQAHLAKRSDDGGVELACPSPRTASALALVPRAEWPGGCGVSRPQ
jgi:hypothetical protein